MTRINLCNISIALLIGTVSIPIQDVLDTSDLSMRGHYDLQMPSSHQLGTSSAEAKIRLSVCFRYIHRPHGYRAAQNQGYMYVKVSNLIF